jgi:hypothetical protein
LFFKKEEEEEEEEEETWATYNNGLLCLPTGLDY